MLMLVAFALQSYVTQTHIHFAGHVMTGGFVFGDDDVGKQAASGTPAGDHDKYPSSDDPANCPICQEMLYAGHYVAPAAIHIFLPTVSVPTIALDTANVVRILAPSYIWQGRAPPTA